MNKTNESDIKRFWSKVAKTDSANDCWEWLAGKCKGGYGQFGLNGRNVGAHRLAWSLHYGRKIPEGMCVLHSCDNPECCNPRHLWLGTNADNMKDMVEKGRSASEKGEDSGRSKLTEVQVVLIREIYPAASQDLLSKVYGVSQQQISRIINGESWQHLEAPAG